MPDKRVRVGIDVGGTFTKAVAIDTGSGRLLARAVVPTTHGSERGVSEGILGALSGILEASGIQVSDIGMISHSTTQAINALLESDTYKVGIIAMGVGPTRGDVVKRTRLDSEGQGAGGRLETCHEFLDTSHLITKQEVEGAVRRLKDGGAEVIVATEAFGVDDPSNEDFVTGHAAQMGLPATASHEISGIYGLEIRTLTAAVNASVLPKTYEVAEYVENAIRSAGVSAPLMVMKGDGGVTSMETFRTRPILTVLSGPAASVAGALLYLRITDGIFIEVGGTSTNICIIRNGRPEIRYVTIRDHPTCIRSMDVRIVGVAGGSMVSMHRGRVSRVGPRSAHIAGLPYSCHADPEVLRSGSITMIRPKSSDAAEYAVVSCGDKTYAITNTCAANALGMIEEGDYAYARQDSARVAMEKLAGYTGTSYAEVATSIIQTSSFEITKAVSRIIKEYKMDSAAIEVIGGGGGASVLVPFVAKQLGIKYQKAEHAEVISSIGAAASMIQEEIEVGLTEPSPERISEAHKRIHALLVEKGAVPESVVIDSKFIPEKAILRVSAVGNVEMESREGSRSVFGTKEAQERAANIARVDQDIMKLGFESEHYFVFAADIPKKRLFGSKKRHHVVILDRYGRTKYSARNARVLCGEGRAVIDELAGFLESGHSEIAPQVYLVNDLKMMDFSGLTSASHILDAVRGEVLDDEEAAVVIES